MNVPPSAQPAPPVSPTSDEADCLRVLREQPFRWYGWRTTLLSAVVGAVVVALVRYLLGWGERDWSLVVGFLVIWTTVDAVRSLRAQRAARRAERLVPLQVSAVTPRRGGADVVAATPAGGEVRWGVADAQGLAAGDTVWAHAPRGGRAILAAFVDASGRAVVLRPRDDTPTVAAPTSGRDARA